MREGRRERGRSRRRRKEGRRKKEGGGRRERKEENGNRTSLRKLMLWTEKAMFKEAHKESPTLN